VKLLAIDASTEALSVALRYDARDVLVEHFEIAPRQHADKLLPAAQALLEAHDLTLAGLDALAFARGPGAFTGLRIAAGLIQGLAIGAGRPVIGVSTLAAVAARAFEHAPAATHAEIVQDARMGEIYTARFMRDSHEPLGPERVIAPQDLVVDAAADTVRAGNGWGLLEIDVPETLRYPHAIDVARLAGAAFQRGEAVSPEHAVPVYVRDDVARKPA
tara:strand:- start:580 stop:1230 length:651 start_codon:yes stop_codon:yes gene_type:complete